MILSLAAFFILANSTAFSLAFDWASFRTLSIPSRSVAPSILVSKPVFSLGYKLSNEPITFFASFRAVATSKVGLRNKSSLGIVARVASLNDRLTIKLSLLSNPNLTELFFTLSSTSRLKWPIKKNWKFCL